MPRDLQCIFCKIVAGEIPASIIHRDESSVAFLDINPLSEGHVLLIPVFHHAQLSQLPAEEISRVASVLPHLGRALLEATGCEGFNVLLNEGAVAGQVVKHAHFHLVPRRSGDQLGYRWNAGKYAPGRDMAILTAYHEALARRSP